MNQKQFDKFWEIRCPECNEPIDLEILINHLNKKVEKVQISTK